MSWGPGMYFPTFGSRVGFSEVQVKSECLFLSLSIFHYMLPLLYLLWLLMNRREMPQSLCPCFEVSAPVVLHVCTAPLCYDYLICEDSFHHN